MQDHGDRIPDAKPLNEILRETNEYGEQIDDTFDGAAEEASSSWDSPGHGHQFYATNQPSEFDTDFGTRMQAAAIAASSFGAAGCFDDEMLIRRANSVFGFIKNGMDSQ